MTRLYYLKPQYTYHSFFLSLTWVSASSIYIIVYTHQQLPTSLATMIHDANLYFWRKILTNAAKNNTTGPVMIRVAADPSVEN